jgi:hypothetical protein
MAIDSLLFDEGASVYYDESFRNVIEDHMTYLRTHPRTGMRVVEPGRAYKYEADFYGLLQFYNIPAALHWTVLRMNRLTSPSEFSLDIETILVPDPDVIEHLRSSHMSTRVLAS